MINLHLIRYVLYFSSFEQTFVRFMRGRHPQTMSTDIDSGLRDALTRELPNTKHVICIWNVLSKISSWFSLLLGSQYADFKAEFEMLFHLDNIEDFEHQWNVLVTRFGLVSDKHVALLYSYRTSWSFSYVRSCFLARMITEEFSQSLESFLKRILTDQTCLQVFFDQVSFSFNLHLHPAVSPFYLFFGKYFSFNLLFWLLFESIDYFMYHNSSINFF